MVGPRINPILRPENIIFRPKARFVSSERSDIIDFEMTNNPEQIK